MGFGVQYETPTLTAAGYEPVADKYSMITTALIDVDDGVSPPILSAIAVQEITNDTGVKTMTDFKQTDAFQDAFEMTPETWIPYYKSEDGSGRASPILSARVVQEITGVIMMECPEQITAQSEPPTSVSVLRTEASTMEQGGVVICRLAGDVVGFDGISTTATLAVKFDEEVQKSVTQAFLGLYS